MPDPIRIEIDRQSLNDVLREVRGLSERMQKSVLKSALRAAGKVIGAEQRRLAPRKTGRLRKAVRWRESKKRPPPGQVWFVVDIHKRIAPYAWYVENGTRYQRAQHFFRRGYEAKKNEAQGVIADAIRKWLARRRPQ